MPEKMHQIKHLRYLLYMLAINSEVLSKLLQE